MKSFILVIFLFTSIRSFLSAQNYHTESLINALRLAKDDSTRWEWNIALANVYLFNFPDSSIIYIKQAQVYANKLKSPADLSETNCIFAWFNIMIGDYSQALRSTNEAQKWAKEAKSVSLEAFAKTIQAIAYLDYGEYNLGLESQKEAFEITKQSQTPVEAVLLYHLAGAYTRNNKPDSARIYLREAEFARSKEPRDRGYSMSPLKYEWGNMYAKKKEMDSAIQAYHEGVQFAQKSQDIKDLMDNYGGLAELFKQFGMNDSAKYYAYKILTLGQSRSNSIVKLKILGLLTEIYKSEKNGDSLAKFRALYYDTNDSLFNKRKIFEVQNFAFDEAMRKKELEDQQIQYQHQFRTFLLAGGFLVVLLIAGLLYRNNLHRKKTQAKLERAYRDLESSQKQLIHSEKMASLGELTAGIAHEIQNPLNFVNNFSEVNTELITEMKDELLAGKLEGAIAIADSIKENEQKIVFHGKRAEAIVKGMLQHSRSGSEQKEPTDINALADEYMRLAYHGLRAKEKEFNATMKTDFDPTIVVINIIPQDIGRVLLNLFNNAFYVVAEKQKQKQLLVGYQPTVLVSTRKIDNQVEISVKDNGNGIPPQILEKIFQPFFTTKPTGQGTGLGLSLSYDIVKAHGGAIKVETKEGEGSEFIITLPA